MPKEFTTNGNAKGQKMKEHYLRIIAAALVFGLMIGGAAFFTEPSRVIDTKGETDIYRFFKVHPHSREEIPECFEGEKEEEILEILKTARKKNYKIKFSPVAQEDMAYNIYLQDYDDVYFITLGKINVVFEDSSKGGYEIVNAEEIIEKIDALLAE